MAPNPSINNTDTLSFDAMEKESRSGSGRCLREEATDVPSPEIPSTPTSSSPRGSRKMNSLPSSESLTAIVSFLRRNISKPMLARRTERRLGKRGSSSGAEDEVEIEAVEVVEADQGESTTTTVPRRRTRRGKRRSIRSVPTPEASERNIVVTEDEGEEDQDDAPLSRGLKSIGRVPSGIFF
eukprot:CAMPEP_0197445214 /NCGR_PEP_ID=MMETSP1175-20131217/10487_1 /TAXON_ID=1003142 /ORGANISM="Triceratium dubium, Strain CCMP147" /LENGTH=181 /DNA_ID=CAMNT_0042976133 /DNA_START=98 /DNA_END=643 /DNA_ORIENTATION=+